MCRLTRLLRRSRGRRAGRTARPADAGASSRRRISSTWRSYHQAGQVEDAVGQEHEAAGEGGPGVGVARVLFGEGRQVGFGGGDGAGAGVGLVGGPTDGPGAVEDAEGAPALGEELPEARHEALGGPNLETGRPEHTLGRTERRADAGGHQTLPLRGGQLRGAQVLRLDLRGALGGGPQQVALGLDFDPDLDGVGGGAHLQHAGEGLLADAADVFRIGLDHGAFEAVAHQGEGDAYGTDDVGVGHRRMRQPQAPRQVGHDGRRPAAAADQAEHAGIQPVIADKASNHGFEARGSQRQDALGQGGTVREAVAFGQDGEATFDRRRAALRTISFGNPPELVARAGRRDGQLDVARGHGQVLLVVHPVRGRLERVGRPVGEAEVGECGDVRTARTDLVELSAAEVNQRTAGQAHGADVERGHVELLAADFRAADAAAAVLDHAEVGAGAADLDEDAIGDAGVEQGGGDAGGRARQHGEDRAAAHLGDVHDTAVAAHDHDRGGDARLADGTLGEVGGVEHLGQHAGVDDGGAGADAQAVEAAHVMRGGGGQAAMGGDGADELLVRRIVYAEGLCGDDDGGAGGGERIERLADRGFGHAVGRNEAVVGGEG